MKMKQKKIEIIKQHKKHMIKQTKINYMLKCYTNVIQEYGNKHLPFMVIGC